jgi:hypothetical protein
VLLSSSPCNPPPGTARQARCDFPSSPLCKTACAPPSDLTVGSTALDQRTSKAPRSLIKSKGTALETPNLATALLAPQHTLSATQAAHHTSRHGRSSPPKRKPLAIATTPPPPAQGREPPAQGPDPPGASITRGCPPAAAAAAAALPGRGTPSPTGPRGVPDPRTRTDAKHNEDTKTGSTFRRSFRRNTSGPRGVGTGDQVPSGFIINVSSPSHPFADPPPTQKAPHPSQEGAGTTRHGRTTPHAPGVPGAVAWRWASSAAGRCSAPEGRSLWITTTATSSRKSGYQSQGGSGGSNRLRKTSSYDVNTSPDAATPRLLLLPPSL